MTTALHQSAYFRLLHALRRLGYGERSYGLIERILAGIGLQPSYGRDLTPRQLSSARRFVNMHWEGRRGSSKLREQRALRRALATRPPVLTIQEAETARIRDAVLGLPTHERDVFLMCRYKHLSYDQIADFFVISKDEAMDRMARALALCTQAIHSEP